MNICFTVYAETKAIQTTIHENMLWAFLLFAKDLFEAGVINRFHVQEVIDEN